MTLISEVQLTLSRDKLKNQDFIPDRVAIINAPKDTVTNRENYYKPTIELLALIKRDLDKLN